jgi:hypothetical protein
VIFIAAAILLIIYLLSIRFNVLIPVAIFWIAIGLIIGIIAYQITQHELSPNYTLVVLSEIAITCLVFHLIYQIPYWGLRGSDAYMDLASANIILSSGFIRGVPEYIIGGTSYFPMIHIYGTQLSLITNIELLFVAKWFPSLLDVICVVLLYMIIRSIFKKEKTALFAALLFASLQHHILFSSLFIRETHALILATCCIYFYLSARSSANPVVYYALSIVSLVGTIFAHHFTSFMLLIYFLVHFLVIKIGTVPFLLKNYFNGRIEGEKLSGTFLLIVFIATFTNWFSTIMSLPVSPFRNLASFTGIIFNPSLWRTAAYGQLAGISTTAIQTTRGFILFYGFLSLYLLLGIILLYGLLPRLRSHRIESLSFSLFLFLCGIGGLLSLYLIPVGVLPYPDRFIMFGWLFAFAPLVDIIYGIKRMWLKTIGTLLLVIFMLFNIYQIEPTAWIAGYEEVPAATSYEDYSLANTLSFGSGSIVTNGYTAFAIYDVRKRLGDSVLDDISLSEYEWIVIQKEALKFELQTYPRPRAEGITIMAQLETSGSLERNRIYESNNLSVFKYK